MAEGKFKDLPSPEYWIARSEELENKVYKSATAMEKELDKIYRQHMAEIIIKIESFFHKYAVDNGITLIEAERALQTIDLADYRVRINTKIRQLQDTGNPFAQQDISNLIKQGQISRLEGLLNELTVELGLLSHNQQESMEGFLGGLYEDAYYQTMYALQTGTGVGVAFASVNTQAVKDILNYPWSGDMFSSRIWKNKDALIKVVKEELTRGMVQGTSTQSMAKGLKDKLNTSTFNARRIIRTEANYFLGEATAKGYKEFGLDKYEFIATLDSRTSKTCGKLDGKVFLLSERQAGVNANPMHPFCRSITAPYFDGMKNGSELRIARDSNGKNYYVPASMTYTDWKSKYVK